MPKTLELANSLVEREPLGRGLASPLSIDPVTKDFRRLEGPDNVKQCIIDLLTTQVGERVMNEDFGTRLPPLLFENADGLVDVIPVHVVEAISRFEPRVRNPKARATVIGNSTIQVQISWEIRTSGRRENMTYPFYLQPEGNLEQ